MGHYESTKIVVPDFLQDFPEKEILRLYISPTTQRKQFQKKRAWVKMLRAFFHYKYIEHLSIRITWHTS